MSGIFIKKEIETHNGLFRIGAVILNEDETWKDDKTLKTFFNVYRACLKTVHMSKDRAALKTAETLRLCAVLRL